MRLDDLAESLAEARAERLREGKRAAHAAARAAIEERKEVRAGHGWSKAPGAKAAASRTRRKAEVDAAEPVVRATMRSAFRGGGYTHEVAAVAGIPTRIVLEAMFRLEREGAVERQTPAGRHLRYRFWAWVGE